MTRKIKNSFIAGLLSFMRANRFNSFLVGFLVILITLSTVYMFITAALVPAVIRALPASAFVDFYSVKVSSAQIGTTPQLELCRRVPFGSVHLDAVRTFIKYNGDKSSEVKEYKFDAEVSDKTGAGECTTLELIQQPQVVGTYSIHTEITFFVEGIRKTDRYDSNKYEMRDTMESIRSEIDKLKQRIRELEARAIVLSDSSIRTVVVTPSNTASRSQTQQNTSSGVPSDNTPNQQGGNPAPPTENPQPAMTVLPNYIEEVYGETVPPVVRGLGKPLLK